MFFKKEAPQSAPLEETPVVLSFEEAKEKIQLILLEDRNEDSLQVFQKASAGEKGFKEKSVNLIKDKIKENRIVVHGMSSEELAKKIYNEVYGFMELTEFIEDNTVDEIRLAPNGRIWITKQGRNIKTDTIIDEQKSRLLIERLRPYDDYGISLDEGNPTLELVRKDNSRLTALCRPVTSSYCFALRKHGTIEVTPQNLVKLKTLDERAWMILKLLVKGRRNILVCGGVNSGKTTLLKLLIGELADNLSIRVLDTDNELRVSEMYSEREIWELEAHSEIGVDLKKLFIRILRLTPDVIIVPEFRGEGEVWTTIEACTRGHDGSMATAHFSSFADVSEILRNIAMLAIKEGVSLPIELVIERVAQAFQIIIQTFSDSRKGVKKITAITEVIVDKGKILENPLVVWEPYTEDFLGEGEWKVLNAPSLKTCKAMGVYGVSLDEIKEVFGTDLFNNALGFYRNGGNGINL